MQRKAFKKKDKQIVLLQHCMQHKQFTGILYHRSQQTAVSAETWEQGVLGRRKNTLSWHKRE